ncbi:MAG: hypothetical protein JXR94_07530 [Candidatus Hydrogenedentes bacterium]|nr:hypothetical protein [Candidatus Hydrogenedentota bacterium]
MRFGLMLVVLPAVSLSCVAAEPTDTMPFTVTNPGRCDQATVARVSIPVPAGRIDGAHPAFTVTNGQERINAQARVISRHPDGSVRRVMIGFPARIPAGAQLEYTAGVSGDAAAPAGRAERFETEAFAVEASGGGVRLLGADGGVLAVAEPFGPDPGGEGSVTVIDEGAHFVWLRYHEDGDEWSREVDVQVSRLGEVTVTHRIQAHPAGDHWTPDFGWTLTAPGAQAANATAGPAHMLGRDVDSRFADEGNADLIAQLALSDGTLVSVANPLALRQNRGTFEVGEAEGAVRIRSNRNEPVDDVESDGLMIQEGAWRFSELVIVPVPRETLAARLDGPICTHADWRLYDAVYGTGAPLDVDHPALRGAVEKAIYALQEMQMKGDDLGSMPWKWVPGQARPEYTSPVRLNHSLYAWEEWFRSGDGRLRKVAYDWLRNYYDLGMYWGPNPEFYGACRRGNLWRDRPGHGPGTFNPRFANTPIYVHKGWSSFYLMFEETGDPRYREAAEAAAEWSIAHQHAGRSYTRTIGVVADAVKMYEYTGEQKHLDNAVHLWETFQETQGQNLLFTESGKPAVGNDLYIGNDQMGYRNPFVKPYIAQYATNGLPYLLKHRPEDRRLRETVFALNDWMATHRQPGGGWGYPHYLTAGMSWNNEYCHGIMLAAEIEPKPIYLDAIRENLAPEVQLCARYGELGSGVNPWESAAGINAKQREEKYKLAIDRDPTRDYEEGQVRFGQSPDNCVYFTVLLRDYLEFATEESLVEPYSLLEKIKQLRTTLDPDVSGPARIVLGEDGTAAVSLTVDFKATGPARASAEIAGLPEGVRAEPAAVEWTAPHGRGESPEMRLRGTIDEDVPITIRWRIGEGWHGEVEAVLEPGTGGEGQAG